jgi:hypothetical protein
MATTLHFQGVQIGDGVVAVIHDNQPQTPAAVLVGLYRDVAAIDVTSTNRLYAIEVSVHWLKSSPVTLARAVQTVQALAHRIGDVVIREAGAVTMRGSDWTLVSAPKPDVREGFGGRWIERWTLRFEGTTATKSS